MEHLRVEASPDARIAVIAAAQHGVVGIADLRAAGLGTGAINFRVRAGRLHRMYRGVFAVGHTRLSHDGRCMAALLSLGPNAVLSHLSAGTRWDLILSDSATIHASVPSPGGRRPRPGIVIHRCTTLAAQDITQHGGFPVTSVARTLLDLAATLGPGPLQRAVERSLILQRFDLRTITDVLERNPTSRGATALATVIATVHDEPHLTRQRLEALMRDLCETHGIERPEFNVQLEGYEVDFFWRRQRLVVETDGHEHHGTRTAFEHDRARDAHLTALGYRVVRFTYRQVLHEPHHVARTLLTLLRAPAGA
ncbi:MAG TPA: type IV toxin-antitoxin system AbiEi family antitoxin domain-containing protein [Solirubrobacteraceae bacterium]|nr:type IV toxin-antitoxin system AbiEi family antitoxin domain-containing protein [Solirubrobacteraceae bacterium]